MQDRENQNPVQTASGKNSADFLKVVLALLKDENRTKLLMSQDNKENTPLHKIAITNSTECAKVLLEPLQEQNRHKKFPKQDENQQNLAQQTGQKKSEDSNQGTLQSEKEQNEENIRMSQKINQHIQEDGESAENSEYNIAMNYLLDVAELVQLLTITNRDGQMVLHEAASFKTIQSSLTCFGVLLTGIQTRFPQAKAQGKQNMTTDFMFLSSKCHVFLYISGVCTLWMDE
jgi:ankyrin repeat protein